MCACCFGITKAGQILWARFLDLMFHVMLMGSGWTRGIAFSRGVRWTACLQAQELTLACTSPPASQARAPPPVAVCARPDPSIVNAALRQAAALQQVGLRGTCQRVLAFICPQWLPALGHFGVSTIEARLCLFGPRP